LRQLRLIVASGVASTPSFAGVETTTYGMHRLIGQCLKAQNPETTRTEAAWVQFFDEIGTELEKEAEHQPGPATEVKHRWLLRQIEHVVGSLPRPEVLSSANVVVQVETYHGSLERAFRLGERVLGQQEKHLKRNPDSAQAIRDVSISLITLGDLLWTRGQAGDVEQAVGLYQRSLDLSETLLTRNPDSAQAIRDVLVSELRVGMSLVQSAGPADVAQALRLLQQATDRARGLVRRNPGVGFHVVTLGQTLKLLRHAARAADQSQLVDDVSAELEQLLTEARRAGLSLPPDLQD
jgi:hypothetical protein